MDAKLVLFLLSLLKQENYKEQIDSTNFYKLMGLENSASMQQVEEKYNLLKRKLQPELYPGGSAYKERFEYLISRIDRDYNEFVLRNSYRNESLDTFEYVPISQMNSDYNLQQEETKKKERVRLISEGPEEFSPPTYVPYQKPYTYDFISMGTSQQSQSSYNSNVKTEKKERVRLISEGPEEFSPPPYIPYQKPFTHDFISEGPETEEKKANVVPLFGGNDLILREMNESGLSISSEQINLLSSKILGVVIRDVKQDISASQMVNVISEFITKKINIPFDDANNLSVQILEVIFEDISCGSNAPEMVENVSEILKNYLNTQNYRHNK